MKVDQIETFKIMEFLIMKDIFSIFLLKVEIYSQNRFQKLSLLINWIFFVNTLMEENNG